jgi:hypothetical protein
MTSSSNDREALISVLDDAFRLYESCTERDCPHHEPDELQDLADAILTEFLPGYTQRVKAEAWDEAVRASVDFRISGAGYATVVRDPSPANPYRRGS